MAIVKSYIANTQKEAFDKIKKNMGEEAVIINTRKIRKKGLWGFIKKPLVEMTAVVDEHYMSENKVKNIVKDDKAEIQAYLKDTLNNEKLERLEKQMSEVSEVINRVYIDMDLIKIKELTTFDDELQKVFFALVENDVSEENALRIIREVSESDTKDKETLQEKVIERICSYLGESDPIVLNDSQKKVVFFVGPTGVGKTTTLAKIAAIFTLKHGANVGIITEDTYRIGAVEQLEIYADILQLPLDVVYEPEEIKDKIKKMKGANLILVDTAGKNTKDEEYHQTIKKMIDNCKNPEVYLVISATTSISSAMEIINSYSMLKDFKLLFTKLDECNKWGMLLDLKSECSNHLSYITQGQNVAEDILLADPKIIANKLLEGEF